MGGRGGGVVDEEGFEGLGIDGCLIKRGWVAVFMFMFIF